MLHKLWTIYKPLREHYLETSLSQKVCELCSICPVGGLITIHLDNPIAQNLLIKQLTKYQLNVIATSNGNEAVEGLIL